MASFRQPAYPIRHQLPHISNNRVHLWLPVNAHAKSAFVAKEWWNVRGHSQALDLSSPATSDTTNIWIQVRNEMSNETCNSDKAQTPCMLQCTHNAILARFCSFRLGLLIKFEVWRVSLRRRDVLSNDNVCASNAPIVPYPIRSTPCNRVLLCQQPFQCSFGLLELLSHLFQFPVPVHEALQQVTHTTGSPWNSPTRFQQVFGSVLRESAPLHQQVLEGVHALSVDEGS